MDKEFKIPTGYIETGEVNSIDTTPFQNGDVLEFHKGREDLKPINEIHYEAMNFAVETPKEEVGLFDREPSTMPEEAMLIGERMIEFRKAKAAGIEPASLAVSALRRQEELDREQFGLAV